MDENRSQQGVSASDIDIARRTQTRPIEAVASSLGLDDVPVCLSKTPASLSDDPDQVGVPHGWELTVRELYPAAGAGFVVALTGDVLTMPGLPADPAATDVEVDANGDIHGLFWKLSALIDRTSGV